MLKKLVRPTYPASFSIALLALIYIIASLISFQVFKIPFHELHENKKVYLGMMLIGAAVIIMLLIIWEEFLFPIKIKAIKRGLIFRNHRTKLKTQILIFCTIPAIFTFIYTEYEVNLIRFLIFAAICIFTPLLEKLASGINNYNDFLKLTDEIIQFKDNKIEGSFKIKNLEKITIYKEEGNIVYKLHLSQANKDIITIHLDHMELDAFFNSIYSFIRANYSHILEEVETGKNEK